MDDDSEGLGWPAPVDPNGAFCAYDQVQLSGAAEESFIGLTFAAKDLYAVAGYRNCAGYPRRLDTSEAATKTAVAVVALVDAGASLAGMTRMDELTWGALGDNRHFETPTNPAASDRLPGGSSSGSVPMGRSPSLLA
jgi:amidase